jgi:hypothetical protein
MEDQGKKIQKYTEGDSEERSILWEVIVLAIVSKNSA